MKKIISLAMAVCAFAACNKEQNAPVMVHDDGPSEVTVNITSETRSTVSDTEAEANVNSLQVFVFNGDRIDAYGSGTGQSLTVSATIGQRDIYAVVNAPSLANISGKDALLATANSLTSDNSSNGFIMVGNVSKALSASSNVTVNVSRIAARVKIDKVTRDFKADGLRALSADKVQLVRYYLSNVVDNNNYGVNADASVWYSSPLCNGYLKTDSGLIYNRLQSPLSISEGASCSFPNSLYCYPNNAVSDSQTARVTRLVVELKIDGSYYTYPILLGKILPNRSYEIRELRITRIGNPSDGDEIIEGAEDDPVLSSSAGFSVVVGDWEQVLISTDGAGEGVVII